MTKTADLTTMAPTATALGQEVLFDGAGLRVLARALHWALIYRRECHLSLATGSAGWDDYPAIACGAAADGVAVPTLAAVATAANVTHVRTDLWIDPDTAALGSLECGAECDVTAAANTVRVTFAFTGGLGTVAVHVDCNQGTNDTEVTTTTVLTGITAGGEWVTCEIAIQRTAGAAADNELRHVRVQETELAIGSVPDPADT